MLEENSALTSYDRKFFNNFQNIVAKLQNSISFNQYDMNAKKNLSEFLVHKKILLAYSGGADSTAVLILLQRLLLRYPVFELSCLYINHGLQELEAQNNELQTVRENCNTLKIDLYTNDDTLKSLNPKNINEEIARNFRYTHIKEHVKKHNTDLVITAHHNDDVVETIYMRNIEGRGIHGLAGIPIITKLSESCMLLRPCISYTLRSNKGFYSNDFKKIVTISNLRFHQDNSNNENIHRRNILRNTIFPKIEQYFPYFASKSIETSHDFQEHLEYEDSYLHYCKWYWVRNSDTKKVISKHTQSFLMQNFAFKKRLLYIGLNLLGQRNISQDFILEILKNLDSSVLKVPKHFFIDNIHIQIFPKQIKMISIIKTHTKQKDKLRTDSLIRLNKIKNSSIILKHSNRAIAIKTYQQTEKADYLKEIGVEYTLHVIRNYNIVAITKHDTIIQSFIDRLISINIKEKYKQYVAIINWQDILVLKDEQGIVAVLGDCHLIPTIIRPKLQDSITMELKIKMAYERISILQSG